MADQPLSDPASFEWEGRPPDSACSGFRLSSGGLSFTFGYAIWSGAVLLYCIQQIRPNPPTICRRFWTSKEAACDAAEDLVGAIYEFADSAGINVSMEEDLNVDDFIEHLHLRLENAFQ